MSRNASAKPNSSSHWREGAGDAAHKRDAGEGQMAERQIADHMAHDLHEEAAGLERLRVARLHARH